MENKKEKSEIKEENEQIERKLINNIEIETIFKEYRNEIRKQKLFKKIAEEIKCKFEIDNSIYKKIVTKNGNTQEAENKYIIIITEILERMNITYKKGGSQQPYDFRDVGLDIGINGMNIEVKKTDSYVIKCNDTCPNNQCYYIIILTKYEKILYMNGYDLLGGSEWIYEYLQEVNILKQKYKKKDKGPVSVYPRPNIDINVKQFI